MASSPKAPAHVRRATRADLPRILQIERRAATAAHWTEADYESALTNASPPRLLLVAELERQVEGFLVARSAHASEWEIENVVVAEVLRRAGIGALLLNAFLEQAQAQKTADGFLKIHLEVRESNVAARSLYEESGFRLDTRRAVYYRDPKEDALLYSLYLP